MIVVKAAEGHSVGKSTLSWEPQERGSPRQWTVSLFCPKRWLANEVLQGWKGRKSSCEGRYSLAEGEILQNVLILREDVEEGFYVQHSISEWSREEGRSSSGGGRLRKLMKKSPQMTACRSPELSHKKALRVPGDRETVDTSEWWWLISLVEKCSYRAVCHTAGVRFLVLCGGGDVDRMGKSQSSSMENTLDVTACEQNGCQA